MDIRSDGSLLVALAPSDGVFYSFLAALMSATGCCRLPAMCEPRLQRLKVFV
jgi:hypothetical protein